MIQQSSSCNQITIYIPENEIVPDILHTFNTKENALMIRIGCECIQNARSYLSELSQEETYIKMKNEMNDAIKTIEQELIIQKELYRQMKQNENERTDTEIKRAINIYKDNEQIFHKKYEKLQDTIMLLKEELKMIELEKICAIQEGIAKEREKYNTLLKENNSQYDTSFYKLKEEVRMLELEKTSAIQEGIAKERTKYDMLIHEKNHQLSRMNDNYEKLSHKTSTLKGIDGERAFSEIMNTFRDFKGFEIIDKTKQSGEGDFYLKFDEFEILADAKNYKKSVPSSEREKIKMDLIKNEHIHFAWLVSLNTTIDKYDKSPIMYEWITTQKCIVYINQLLHYDNPSQILRIAWFSCRELFKLVETTNTGSEIEVTSLRETQYKMIDKVKNVRKTIRELNTTISQLKKQVESIDYELKDILELETNNIVDSNIYIFNSWWENNIQNVDDIEKRLKSTEIWLRFKQENKAVVKESQLTPDKFKEFIKTILPSSSYEIRSNNGAFDIKGVVWK